MGETRSAVHVVPAADSVAAKQHFAGLLAFETDCSDVHDAIARNARDFVLLDVRSPDHFAAGHLPEAINVPHRKITLHLLSSYDAETLFVVYCAGPHCNGADKAAHRLAQLGRPVKKMLGGVTGWLDEGFALVSGGA